MAKKTRGSPRRSSRRAVAVGAVQHEDNATTANNARPEVQIQEYFARKSATDLFEKTLDTNQFRRVHQRGQHDSVDDARPNWLRIGNWHDKDGGTAPLYAYLDGHSIDFRVDKETAEHTVMQQEVLGEMTELHHPFNTVQEESGDLFDLCRYYFMARGSLRTDATPEFCERLYKCLKRINALVSSVDDRRTEERQAPRINRAQLSRPDPDDAVIDIPTIAHGSVNDNLENLRQSGPVSLQTPLPNTPQGTKRNAREAGLEEEIRVHEISEREVDLDLRETKEWLNKWRDIVTKKEECQKLHRRQVENTRELLGMERKLAELEQSEKDKRLAAEKARAEMEKARAGADEDATQRATGQVTVDAIELTITEDGKLLKTKKAEVAKMMSELGYDSELENDSLSE